jgi:hypothetical protein
MKTEKIKLRRSTKLISFVAVSIVVCEIMITPNNSFSGKWLINITKSEFGTLTPEAGAAKEIKIDQKKDAIEFERIFGSSTSKETLSNDGKQVEQDMPNDTKKISSLKWSDNSKQFIVTSIYKVANNGNPWEYTRTETYTLSTDGKTLTLDRVTVIPDRTDVVKAVYERQ